MAELTFFASKRSLLYFYTDDVYYSDFSAAAFVWFPMYYTTAAKSGTISVLVLPPPVIPSPFARKRDLLSTYIHSLS